MRAFHAILGLLVLGGPAFAGKETSRTIAQPNRVPCDLQVITHDWDFAAGDQGFTVTDCDEGGVPSWEYGQTDFIPGAPGAVWGTVLEGDYSDYAGGGLVSPPFLVDAQSCFLEVQHYFDTETDHDGGNVSVGVWPYSQIITPIGGYSASEISSSLNYYAYCVDSEPGWTGHDAAWRVDCFDLTEYLGQVIQVEFDFGSDESTTCPGWYLSAVRTGSPTPLPHVCCDLYTGECAVTFMDSCLESGGDFHPEWISCEPNPCPQPLPGAHLRLGNWFEPEPWHDWIPAIPESEIQVEVHPGDIPEPIQAVEFYMSTDQGASWQLFGVDADGYEPHLNTYDPGVQPMGDGWSAIAVSPLPIPAPVLLFKALVYSGRSVYVVAGGSAVDPAPPSLGRTNIEDWMISDRDTMGVSIDPNGADLERIIVFARYTEDAFVKGIPGIDQHLLSDYHCAPTAAAQCLRYFELHGDNVITGGLDDEQLVGALATEMQTNLDDGTYMSRWSGGLTSWIQGHGSGYTVRLLKHYVRDGGHTWQPSDFTNMRNELERCQDVLLGIFWGFGGGHALTLDGILNRPLENGRVALIFKDPWTGQTSTGDLDTGTGYVYNVSGAGLGSTGYLGATMLACPAESTVAAGGPGLPIFDGLPGGPPPYFIPVPVPQLGLWSLHFVLVNSLGHSWRMTRLIVREDPNGVEEGLPVLPVTLDLRPITPNPFETSATILYSLPQRTGLSLQVFDVMGRTIRTLVDDEVGPGVHQIAWNGRDELDRPAAAGVYFVKMRTSALEKTRTVTLLR